jgi:hypothetical protein
MTITGIQRAIFIWKHERGARRLHCDIFNSDGPQPVGG